MAVLVTLDHLLTCAIKLALGTAMLLITACITFSITARYIFNAPPIWGEDIPRILFVWMTMLGLCILARDNLNIRVSYFLEKFHPKVQLLVLALFHLLILCLLVVTFTHSFTMVGLTSRSLIISTGWPASVMTLSVPVGMALVLPYQLRAAIRDIARLKHSKATLVDVASPTLAATESSK